MEKREPSYTVGGDAQTLEQSLVLLLPSPMFSKGKKPILWKMIYNFSAIQSQQSKDGSYRDLLSAQKLKTDLLKDEDVT